MGLSAVGAIACPPQLVEGEERKALGCWNEDGDLWKMGDLTGLCSPERVLRMKYTRRKRREGAEG